MRRFEKGVSGATCGKQRGEVAPKTLDAMEQARAGCIGDVTPTKDIVAEIEQIRPGYGCRCAFAKSLGEESFFWKK